VLPSGLLREPLAAARSADAVLVYGTDGEAERVAAALGVARAFRAVPRYGSLQALDGTGAARDGDGRPPSIRHGGRVVAVAGIARPERFFGALVDSGFEVAREVRFRDHHWFSAADVDRIETIARGVGADSIVTTEKDAVRVAAAGALRPRTSRRSPSAGVGSAGPRWAVLPMEVVIEPADQFAPWVGQRV
jgi:tetraacyldisaccharide 4'-kinase